jgi:hypothetical protein
VGTVIRFPDERRASWSTISVPIETIGSPIVILPVIRIERQADGSVDGTPPGSSAPNGRGRRRPEQRS